MHAVQITSHQLQLQQEADRKAQEAAAEEASKAKKRVVTEDSYSQLVDSHNVNRDAGDDGARSVTEALSALGVQEGEDKHPERYFAASLAVCQHCPKLMSECGSLLTAVHPCTYYTELVDCQCMHQQQLHSVQIAVVTRCCMSCLDTACLYAGV